MREQKNNQVVEITTEEEHKNKQTKAKEEI